MPVIEKFNRMITNPDNYEGLTPTITEDKKEHKDDPYTKALFYALTDSEIKNIAISGPFGAGKSSFIYSFEHHHKGYWNFLNISLATFKDSSTKTPEGDEKQNQLIERSILQQLLYKVEKNEIPRSRFKRIQKISNSKIILQLAVFLTWIVSISLIFKSNLAKKFLNFSSADYLNQLNDLPLFPTTTISIATISSIILMYMLYKHLLNMRISKLNFLKGEIGVDDSSNASILNEHLDEILYFFEATKYDVVVIEDLDRANNEEIFIKLREINELINKSDQVKKPKVTFLYAIKDDMFKDETRTKFFDFMIPILPYINRSNSIEKLKPKLPKDFDNDEFLEEIAEYIDDMRLLKNIFTEFKVYDEKIKTVNKAKQLAMIIYKNIYPEDFSKLHKNEGMLATVFSNTRKYQRTFSEVNNLIINNLNEELENLEEINSKELIESLFELRSLYIYKLIEKYKLNEGAYIITGTEASEILVTETIKSDEKFNLLISSNTINNPVPPAFNTRVNYYHEHKIEPITVSFSDIETDINPNLSYEDRVGTLSGRLNQKIQEKKEEKETREKENQEIARYSLKRLLTHHEIREDFNSIIPNENLLLRRLLLNGYIEEDYHTYISHFFPGSITEQDRKFLLAVNDDDDSLGYEYKLQKTSSLIKKIRAKEFKSSAVLNFDLLDEFLKKPASFPEKFKLIKELLQQNTKQVNQFIDEYFLSTMFKGDFTKQIIRSRQDFWEYAVNNSELSDTRKNDYLAWIIKTLEIKDIQILNKDNLIKNYLDNMYNYIEFSKNNDIPNDKSEALLKELNISFIGVNKLDSNCDLSKYIYKHNHYQLNLAMINSIIEVFSND